MYIHIYMYVCIRICTSVQYGCKYAVIYSMYIYKPLRFLCKYTYIYFLARRISYRSAAILYMVTSVR